MKETIEVIKSYPIGPNPTFKDLPIASNLFCELLKMCTSFNQFSFAGKHYRQAPMCSSLSPILTNIFMEHFETHLIKDIPVEYRPLSWFRFVDDVICCYKDMAKFNDFLTLLNGIRPTIQFTYELSRTERTLSGTTDLPDDIVEAIPFLELLVIRRTNGNFTFSIYRKSCHDENYLYTENHCGQKSVP